MAYYLDIFSPATYEAFSKSTKDVAGVRRVMLVTQINSDQVIN